jgi:hypothetical protein
MTIEEIRGVEIRPDTPDSETLRNGVRMLREIAAQLVEFNERERLALQPNPLRKSSPFSEIPPARPADPTSGTDQARAILSPPAAAQSKSTASPIALRDRWARDRKGNELPNPEGTYPADVHIWKTEQKEKYLRVTWTSSNGSGFSDANCFDAKLWPWLIQAKAAGQRTRLYLVVKGKYLNVVGVRA